MGLHNMYAVNILLLCYHYYYYPLQLLYYQMLQDYMLQCRGDPRRGGKRKTEVEKEAEVFTA